MEKLIHRLLLMSRSWENKFQARTCAAIHTKEEVIEGSLYDALYRFSFFDAFLYHLLVLSVVCSEIKNSSESTMRFSFLPIAKFLKSLPRAFCRCYITHWARARPLIRHHSANSSPKKIDMAHQSIYPSANTISDSLIA
jgi:hypothetical protein